MIRSFIAVEIPNAVRNEVAKIIDNFSQANYPVRWVNKENLHLTLIFLGEIQKDFLDKVNKALGEATKNCRPFEMNLNGIGAFPSQRTPRIIWIGVKQGQNEIIELQANVERPLVKIGYKPEAKKFHPHLTIGRVKGFLKDASQIFETNYSSPPFLIKSIVLFKSTLRPEGPIYEKLGEFDFG